MTLVALPGGFIYPSNTYGGQLLRTGAPGSFSTLDATAEKYALMGRVQMNGRTASAKTISAAGGGSISFRTGACTFADVGTTLDVGIQDMHATTSLPDGTFDVKATLTGGAGITASAWNTVSMTGGTGSKIISHGDQIAIVLDMTARAGVDSVIIQGFLSSLYGTTSSQSLLPAAVNYTTSWQTSRAIPNVLMTFDDGTIATLEGGMFYSYGSAASEGFSDSTNPDERGSLFQVPFACKVGGYAFPSVLDSITTSDFSIALWSDPFGTPAAVSGSSLTLAAESLSGQVFYQGGLVLPLPAEVALAANTDYVLALKATGAAGVNLFINLLGAAAHRALLPGGTTVAKVTRNGGTGVFTAESPALTRYTLGMVITQIHDGAGGGSGGAHFSGFIT